MLTSIWKLAGYTHNLRCLDNAVKPVVGLHKYNKMSFRRGVGSRPRQFTKAPVQAAGYNRPKAYNDYDYNYDYNYVAGYGGPAAEPQEYETHEEMQRREMRERCQQVHPMWKSPLDQNVRPVVDANCGELRERHRGNTVRLRGRVQYQRLNRFLSLRDSSGTIQLVAMEERLDLIKRIRQIPLDSHIEIIGTVELRPPNPKNPTMVMDEVEIILDDIVDVATPKRKMGELGGEDAPGRTGKKIRSSTLITSTEVARCETEAVKRKFSQRSHNCGELNEAHIGSEVSLCGWVERKSNDRFVILRDGYGATQLVINPGNYMVTTAVQNADVNTLVTVKGVVSLRPVHQRNSRMATGNVEVKVNCIELIDPHEPIPTSEDKGTPESMELDSTTGVPPGDVNSYSARTHTCGQLRGGDVGRDVVLCGWLDTQRMNRFATIRDGHGSTQLLIPQNLEGTVGQVLSETPLESVIMVVGTVCARPPEQVTEKLATGEVEVVVKQFSVMNPAKRNLPFIVRQHNRPKENLRMKYRYLDLRYSDMQYRLRLRSRVLMRMREFLINQRGFVEVETPTLFRRTPGGAQEYIVPTRFEDKFYSLVQSPQQLKQLLMVGALDRYFQVARCYRDEGARPDRQPEFTQMDIEMSFTDRESIMSLIEELLRASWPEELSMHTPFPVLTYHDCMHWYGTDKPDLSFDKKIMDISELIPEDRLKTLPNNLGAVPKFTAKALVFGPNYVSKLKDALQQCEELRSKKGWQLAKLVQVRCVVNKWEQAVQAALPFIDHQKLKELLGLQIPSTVVVAIGAESQVLPLMGKLRSEVFKAPTNNFHFAWVVDFPLFLEGEEEGAQLESAHHPFTQAHQDDAHLLYTDPLKVRGLHFDLVLNGYEVGGGSVRIHDPETQAKVLRDILRLPTDSLDHLLEALQSGAPPHGGIALGMDRLLAVLVGAESIRDVMAFPKGVDGRDPLSGAPCDITDAEKQLYHIRPRRDAAQ